VAPPLGAKETEDAADLWACRLIEGKLRELREKPIKMYEPNNGIYLGLEFLFDHYDFDQLFNLGAQIMVILLTYWTHRERIVVGYKIFIFVCESKDTQMEYRKKILITLGKFKNTLKIRNNLQSREYEITLAIWEIVDHQKYYIFL
ncbi:hypothetical protein ACJX0J_009164, partial [Zea mays]